MRHSIVVVGGSLAGLRAAEELRQQGFDGRITVVGDEPHRPYDRPPLSKQVLAGAWEPDQIALGATVVDDIDDLDLDWRLGGRATALDLARRVVTVQRGASPAESGSGAAPSPTGHDASPDDVPFDGLVIATGATPRVLPPSVPGADLPGLHTLRTLDDCLTIRAALDATPGRVVVIGAGFIGAEVAATCRGRGLDVTLVEALPVPMERALGLELGRLMAEIHRDHGVDLRLGTGVAGFDGTDRVEHVRLADGTVVPADVVVVGVGVAPCTSWLDGSGLILDDGVVCDPSGRAAPGVVAAGDVARWPSRRFNRMLRVEHWDNAIAMGEHAARCLLADIAPGETGETRGTGEANGGADEPYDPVPWFWSDQYDRKLQLAGVAAGADEMVVVDGSFDERRFAAIYRGGDRIVGVVGMNRPRQVVVYRRLIERDASWDEALELTSS